MRLISSGMVRSNDRSPASTWATGMPRFTATSAHAIVELTSPTTTTPRGEVVLERRHDPAGLHAVAGRADLEVDVGAGQPELLEEHPGHVTAVVLAGVDQDPAEPLAARQLAHERRQLHEVRPGTRDQHD